MMIGLNGCRFAAAALGLTAVLALAAGRTEAANLSLSIEPSAASAGGVGAFDVYLEVSGGSANVSGFSFGLEVVPGSGITFTGATDSPTTAPYLFSSPETFAFTLGSAAWSLNASDSMFSAPGHVTLAAGARVGLGRVFYAVAAGAPAGNVVVSFQLNGVTEVFDEDGYTPLAFDATPGTITINAGGGAIPEPASLVMMGLAAAPLLVAARRRSG